MGSEVIVAPGHLISTEEGFMRGHGTILLNGSLYATVAGVVEKINKLVCVNPLKCRYLGDIGDVVIGRISEVGQKRWKVDVGSHQDATLQLSAINLPGGIQRRKQESDERQMRSFYSEGEIVCAEVQLVHQNDSISVHTRNYKYGKLCTGTLINVSPSLVKRSRSYFHSLAGNIEIIIGLNGFIWVGKLRKWAEMENLDTAMDTDILEQIYANVVENVDDEMRVNIARIVNCISALEKEFCFICYESISTAYFVSLRERMDVFSILDVTNTKCLVEKVKEELSLKAIQTE